MKRLLSIIMILALGGCAGNYPPPVASTPDPSASAWEYKAGSGILTEGGEACGNWWDVRIVGRLLDGKGKLVTGRTAQMTAINLLGFGEITDAKGVHVDEGYSTRVTMPFVMCLVVEHVLGQGWAYHVQLKFSNNVEGRSVECDTYDSAYGLGILSMNHAIGPTEAVCEYQYPPIK